MRRRALYSHVVVAMDEDLYDALRGAGLSTYHLDCGLGSADVRGSEEGFRMLGMCKVAFVHSMLAHGMHVLLSDNDALWLRDPRSYFLDPKWNAAQIFISTDCLGAIADAAMTAPAPSGNVRGLGNDSREASMRLRYGDEADLSKLPWYANPALGGHPWERNGNIVEAAFNTGVLFLRGSAEALAFTREWIQAMDDAMRAFKSGLQMHVRDDQQAFNNVIRRNFLPPTLLEPDNTARIFQGSDGKIGLMIMPLDVVANGHVFFAQRSAQSSSKVPFAVHNTFNFYGSGGKEARFKEAGLWAEERAARLAALAASGAQAPSRERFLTWAPGVPADVLAPPQLSPLEPGLAHIRALAYQILSTRNAMVLARALNRTLIVPSMVCFCDRYYNVIAGGDSPEKASCRAPGSDLELPFVCPLDYVLDPAALDRAGVRWHSHAFLVGGHSGGDGEPAVIEVHKHEPPRLRTREVAVALDIHTGRAAVDAIMRLWGIDAEVEALLRQSGTLSEQSLGAIADAEDESNGSLAPPVRASASQGDVLAAIGSALAKAEFLSASPAALRSRDVLSALGAALEDDVLVLSSVATALCDVGGALRPHEAIVRAAFQSEWCCTPKGVVRHHNLPALPRCDNSM